MENTELKVLELDFLILWGNHSKSALWNNANNKESLLY